MTTELRPACAGRFARLARRMDAMADEMEGDRNDQGGADACWGRAMAHALRVSARMAEAAGREDAAEPEQAAGAAGLAPPAVEAAALDVLFLLRRVEELRSRLGSPTTQLEVELGAYYRSVAAAAARGDEAPPKPAPLAAACQVSIRERERCAEVVESYAAALAATAARTADRGVAAVYSMYAASVASAASMVRALSPSSPAPPGDPPPPAMFGYVNHRGVFEDRSATPLRVYYGSSEHHPAPTWLVDAYDHVRLAVRTFSLDRMGPRAET